MPCPDDRARELSRLLPEITRHARRLCRSREAGDDLAQEALLRVWARLASGAEIEDLRAYLFAALRNLSRRPPRRTESLTEADAPAVPPAAGARLATRDVLLAVAGLPDAQAVLLRALAADGTSLAELARRHRLPLGTVMSRVARGRARLIRRLDLPRKAPVAALLRGGP